MKIINLCFTKISKYCLFFYNKKQNYGGKVTSFPFLTKINSVENVKKGKSILQIILGLNKQNIEKKQTQFPEETGMHNIFKKI